jgi:hypothetical protein
MSLISTNSIELFTIFVTEQFKDPSSTKIQKRIRDVLKQLCDEDVIELIHIMFQHQSYLKKRILDNDIQIILKASPSYKIIMDTYIGDKAMLRYRQSIEERIYWQKRADKYRKDARIIRKNKAEEQSRQIAVSSFQAHEYLKNHEVVNVPQVITTISCNSSSSQTVENNNSQIFAKWLECKNHIPVNSFISFKDWIKNCNNSNVATDIIYEIVI